MRYLFIVFIFLSINLKSQSNKYKLQGCENPKGKEMKNICNSSLNQLISHYFEKYIKKYGQRIPEGETNLVYTITKNGNITDITYSDFKNEKFAKFAIIIINDIKRDLEKYDIRLNPIIDKISNEPIDFEMKTPLKLYYN